MSTQVFQRLAIQRSTLNAESQRARGGIEMAFLTTRVHLGVNWQIR